MQYFKCYVGRLGFDGEAVPIGQAIIQLCVVEVDYWTGLCAYTKLGGFYYYTFCRGLAV